MSGTDRPIFLVGFMGSGKSRVGRALARDLGWVFVDTDGLVERREGRSVARIFAESGEARFRELEWEVLQAEGMAPGRIVATGGGMFARAAPRRFMLRHGRTIWIDVPLELAVPRVRRGSQRPLWNPDDPIAFRAFFECRRAAYALAEHRVDGSKGSPRAVTRRVLDLLEPSVFH